MSNTSTTLSRALPAPGLDGVIAARTRLSDVQGERGRLIVAGYPIEAIASRVGFESMVHLLLFDRLPDPAELDGVRAELVVGRHGDAGTREVLVRAAASGVAPIDALRLGLAHLSTRGHSPLALLGALPAVVADHHRLASGLAPVEAPPELSHAEGFLLQLRGTHPAAREIRALDTYWNTVIDHGLNASTFTARIIASTGSDVGAALEGALAALKGPLHGGAPGPALAALLQLRHGEQDLAEATRRWAEARLDRGERIMGFGHRVYRVRDPRADVLGAAARELLPDDPLLRDAEVHEQAVLETLARHKPGRRIATNVEFYTALLLHGLGFPETLFTPVFALGRAAGWIAHVAEQQRTGRLLRPGAEYVGAAGRSLPSR
jgi:citrate synthase